MLSTDLPTVLALAVAFMALCVAGAAAFFAVRSARNVSQVALWVHQKNAKSASLKRIAELEATMTELLDSYDSLLTSHKKLRARIGMRAAREKRVSEPDLTTETDKAALRHAARAAGMLR